MTYRSDLVMAVTRELLVEQRLDARTAHTAIEGIENVVGSLARLGLLGPIPMRIHCPTCGQQHVDEGKFATKPHHTHACQFCGLVWRPAAVETVGVRFLPDFKDEALT